jgi:D-lactate dehydrogenase (cytochrome)
MRAILLLSSLASGTAGYLIAKTKNPDPPACITGNDAHELQYGTPSDFQEAIKQLRSTFPSGDDVSTDIDDLRTHGISLWDHHAGA